MTAKSAIPAVWAAIYSAINVASITAAAPTGLGCAVYDYVPQASAYPYVRMQAPTEVRSGDTMGTAGKDVTVQLHVFTSSAQYRGAGQAQAIVSQLSALLEYPDVTAAPFDLTADGWDCLLVRPEDAQDVGDEDYDGVIVNHYMQLVRVQVQER